jgi:hypothetical protein
MLWSAGFPRHTLILPPTIPLPIIMQRAKGCSELVEVKQNVRLANPKYTAASNSAEKI